MRISSLGYLIKQGWKNLAGNRLMSFASIGVLTACLIITGIASLLSVNVNRIVDYLGNQNEIIAYIDDEISDEEALAIGERIGAMGNVLSYEYVTRAQAFDDIQGWLSEYADLLEGLEHIFPRQYRVTVDDLTLMAQTNAEITTFAGIDDTVAPSEVAGVMITIKNAVTYGGWGLVAVLAIVSIIVISNTIRLTVFARRREISIMKYVGATNTFIRMPFFVEGMTVGAIAGLLSSGLVLGAYHLVYGYITASGSTWVASIVSSILPLSSVWAVVLVGFVAFGMFIGGIGTTTSIRKHLKV